MRHIGCAIRENAVPNKQKVNKGVCAFDFNLLILFFATVVLKLFAIQEQFFVHCIAIFNFFACFAIKFNVCYYFDIILFLKYWKNFFNRSG